ncbi:MAG: MMPL family transporter [Lachnospiraceae bacterium]|nr:MMPL family transporter [Lachnospiraceae bacterium]
MENNNIMYNISRIIVDGRQAFFVLFIIAAIFCATQISKVEVEDDISQYLPEDTETRQGVDIMDNEFETHGTAKVLLANITYERALSVAKGLKNIDGLDRVQFYDAEDSDYDDDELNDYYRDSAALITITFDEEEKTDLSQKAIAEVRSFVQDYDNYVYTTVDLDESAELMKDIRFILGLVAIIIVGVLLFTSSTYAEVPIFILTFGMAAVLNKGTNYIFGTISYISNAVDAILQLALAIDYAIILFHRYMEERDNGLPPRDAMVTALAKAIVEISSSSLTTISGLIALVFMHFKIGQDLGLVLCKAIIFSMLTVFFFMPALIMMFRNAIEKSRHKNFVPSINHFGKLIYHTRFIIPVLFLGVIVIASNYSSRCPYIFDTYTARGPLKTPYIEAKDRIDETFETGNNVAIILPKGDYAKEAAIIADLKGRDYIDTILALANVEVGDEEEYILTDSLNPREFADVASIDAGLSKLLYTAYAQDKEIYGAFIDGIDEYRIPVIDLIDFIYDKKEQGAFNLSAKQSQDITDIHDDITTARKQLESEDYSRIIFVLNGPAEGEETYGRIAEIREMAQSYYKERIYVVGEPTSNFDLSSSFNMDNTLISVLTALFVGIILLFTFQSVSLPFILLITIQGSIWINFSIPYLQNKPLFFLCYLIVSSIQMGATIDYAIVITNRYVYLRKELGDKKSAIIRSLNEAFPTILTSGSILTASGFIVANFTSNATISQLGTALGRGTLTSILLVMLVLPQLLCIFDFILDRTFFRIGGSPSQNDGNAIKEQQTVVIVNGLINGRFNGYLIGEFRGTMRGDVDLRIRRGSARKQEGADGSISTGFEDNMNTGSEEDSAAFIDESDGHKDAMAGNMIDTHAGTPKDTPTDTEEMENTAEDIAAAASETATASPSSSLDRHTDA